MNVYNISLLLCLMVSNMLAMVEKKLVVIIPSYNNERWYERNLASLFLQEYNNYRVIYIDDCSTDNTYKLVKEYIMQQDQQDRVTIIHNKKRRGAMPNWYHAIHSCDDYEIVVSLDGDDWWYDTKALVRINQVYQEPCVWMTYGSFISYPTGEKGFCRQVPHSVIEQNTFRYHQFVTSHARTFYAWLFKKIKREDLLKDGKFFPMLCDQAMMFPMLEMAGDHAVFIPDIIYVYNRDNPISDEKIDIRLFFLCEKIIRAKSRYQRLKKEPHVL